jgi:transposase, IS30 family
LSSHNDAQIKTNQWNQAIGCVLKRWSPVQIANQVDISHETIYRNVYVYKAAGGNLYQQLRCQKKRKKRYSNGLDRRGKIVGRRPISKRS